MTKKIDPEEWALPYRAAQLFGVSDTSVRRWISRGEVDSRLLGGDTLICNLVDVQQVAALNRERGRPRLDAARD